MLVFALDGSHTKQRKKYEIEDGHQISSNKICKTKKMQSNVDVKKLAQADTAGSLSYSLHGFIHPR